MNARTLPSSTFHQSRVDREQKRWCDPGQPISQLLAWLSNRLERRRQHEILARLDDRLLVDVALERDDAAQWVREPFSRL